LSQERAAHQVERSDRWSLQVENGQTDPTYGDLVRLAPVLHVELQQLVLGNDRLRQTRPPQETFPKSANWLIGIVASAGNHAAPVSLRPGRNGADPGVTPPSRR